MAILIVDDIKDARQDLRNALEHPSVRKSLEKILSSTEITEASSGQEALRLLKKGQFDLAIIDIAMPGMNGFELTEKILSQTKIPIVYNTGTHAKDALYVLVSTKLTEALPADVVTKSYAFPLKSEEGYRRELIRAIQNAHRRLGRNMDISALEKAISELNRTRGETDWGYLKDVFKELKKKIDQLIPSLPEEYQKPARAIDWKFEFDNAGNLVHTIKYPVDRLISILAEVKEAKPIMGILGKINAVCEEWRQKNKRYSPDIVVCSRVNEELVHRQKIEMPTTKALSKLEIRERMLNARGTPYFIIKQEEDPKKYSKALREVLRFSPDKQAIARSVLDGEDSIIGLAGAFKSVPNINNSKELIAAAKSIRDLRSEHLTRLCLYRGYEELIEKRMRIIVEPFFNTKYLGAILEHQLDGVYLIEFVERSKMESKDRKNYFLVYDINKGIVASRLPFKKGDILAEKAVQLVEKQISLLGLDRQICRQTEIGFYDVSDDILPFQLRDFKTRHNKSRFLLENSDYTDYRVIGRTKGLNLVVIRTDDPASLYIAGENAKEDKLKVCYIVDEKTEPNIATYTDNLGAVVLGRDFAVQGHDSYNAMRNADIVLMLTQKQLSEFPYEHGRVIHLVSDGIRAKISPLDRSERFKYKVREILNEKD